MYAEWTRFAGQESGTTCFALLGFGLAAEVLSAGPGWVVLWALKQMGGAILAVFIFSEVGPELVVEPIRQYVAGIEPVIPNGFAALAVATFLVVLSQAKINVTNATRGSLS